jgi:hypothetical protein
MDKAQNPINPEGKKSLKPVKRSEEEQAEQNRLN